MKRIPRDEARVYGLDGSLPPALRVEAGETFVIETNDASTGLLTAGDKLPTPDNTPYTSASPATANPVGGPVHVDGVEAGGRVEVEIVEIALAAHGVAYNQPPISPLGNAEDWPEAREYFIHRVEHGEHEARIDDRLRWPVWPMIGTLACAPEWEVRSSATGQGPWGGNLDVLDYRPGARVTLTSYHDGGLLFVGDVHGCQGDTEYFGTADESEADVTLRARPVEGGPLPAPRVVSDDTVVALGIARPLEDASHAAIRHLLDWLVEDYGFTRHDAYVTVGLHPAFRLRIYQMTSIDELDFVVGATLPRAFVER